MNIVCDETTGVSASYTAAEAPDRPTLNFPGGTQYASAPTFSWSIVTGAKTYKLVISKNGCRVFGKRYQASDRCSAGVCTATPRLRLKAGRYSWKVRARHGRTRSGWSDSMSFTCARPERVTATTPSGETTDSTPTYVWNQATGAWSYGLKVVDSRGLKIRRWLAAETCCSDGVCQLTPSTALDEGEFRWKVRARNGVGQGPWSDVMRGTLDTDTNEIARLTVRKQGSIARHPGRSRPSGI